MSDVQRARQSGARGGTRWLAGGLVLAAVTVIAIVGLTRRSANGRPESTEASGAERPPSASASGPAGDAEEVRRLRAQLRQKDAVIRALLAAPKAAPAPEQGTAAAPSKAPAAEADSEAKAAEMLDERMYAAPKNPAKATEMEQSLRQIADARTLGDAKVIGLECGSTLCKVALSAEKPEVLGKALSALIDRLPKRFGASTVFRQGDGQTALYVGNSSADLAPPSEN